MEAAGDHDEDPRVSERGSVCIMLSEGTQFLMRCIIGETSQLPPGRWSFSIPRDDAGGKDYVLSDSVSGERTRTSRRPYTS